LEASVGIGEENTLLPVAASTIDCMIGFVASYCAANEWCE